MRRDREKGGGERVTLEIRFSRVSVVFATFWRTWMLALVHHLARYAFVVRQAGTLPEVGWRKIWTKADERAP